MAELAIIPQPVHLTPLEGDFIISSETAVLAGAGSQAAAEYFCRAIAPATGFALQINPSGQPGQSTVEFKLDAKNTRWGAEGYQLEVSPQRMRIHAGQPAGLFYGVQTLLQLLPPEIYQQAQAGQQGRVWSVPGVKTEDYPRFGWRGTMLDVSRHFMPKDFVLKFLDLMAMHKLNVFHWHLTDDQGWRIEIKKYPRLTEIGAWRAETLVGHHRENKASPVYDGKPHGGFYSQEDIRGVVAYAQARGITIVPEIEMPGHAQAAIAAYPELGNTGKQLEVSKGWSIHENVYNVDESTILFLQDVLAEVLDLFPSEFIHIGGDEVPKIQWRESPAAQARKGALGLQSEEELQSYFIRRMDQFLTSHGRRLVGWDEILEGGLAPNATVMSWRGEEGGIKAAQAGHDVVMASRHHTYLDYYQAEDHSQEPLAIGNFLPLEKVYEYEPVPAELTPEQAKHVLGTQAQQWTEYIPTPEVCEYMTFPRLCAFAEVAWSPGPARDFSDFKARLKAHMQRLDALGVKYRALDSDLIPKPNDILPK